MPVAAPTKGIPSIQRNAAPSDRVSFVAAMIKKNIPMRNDAMITMIPKYILFEFAESESLDQLIRNQAS